MSDLRVLFLFYMVEAALVGYVGMALIGIRLNLKQFVLVGLCQGLIVYFVRGFYTINELPFGTHVFFNLTGLIIVLYFVTRNKWGICTVGSLLGFITVILSEMLVLPPVYKSLQLTFEISFADAWLHIATGYLGDWLLILAALFLFVSKKSLVDLNPFN